jgi:hypothetical protein
MSNPVLDHFSLIDAYWINLERDPERRDRMLVDVLGHFKAQHRIEAVDGRQWQEEEAYKWRDQVLATHERDAAEDNILRRRKGPAGMKHLSTNERTRKLYLRTAACYGSHLRALYQGILSGAPRFMVFEDDAALRLGYTDEITITEEVAEAEMIIWGGAIPLAAHKTDNEDFAAGRKPRWVTLPKGDKLYTYFCATAYEVTSHGARVLYDEMRTHPHGADVSWWFGINKLRTVRLAPVLFPQTGESSRLDGVERTPVLNRSV